MNLDIIMLNEISHRKTKTACFNLYEVFTSVSFSYSFTVAPRDGHVHPGFIQAVVVIINMRNY